MIDNKVLKIYKVQMTSQESRTPEPPRENPLAGHAAQSREVEGREWVGAGVGTGLEPCAVDKSLTREFQGRLGRQLHKGLEQVPAPLSSVTGRT